MKLPIFDLPKNVLLRFPGERRITAKEDVEDHAARPNIAFFIVVFIQNFRGDVIRLNNE